MDGVDGLDFYRIIAKESRNYLKKNGVIFVEIGYKQKADIMNIFREEQYKDMTCKKDLSGNDRVIKINIEN